MQTRVGTLSNLTIYARAVHDLPMFLSLGFSSDALRLLLCLYAWGIESLRLIILVHSAQIHADQSPQKASPLVANKTASTRRSMRRTKSDAKPRRKSSYYTRKMRTLKNKAIKTSRDKGTILSILAMCTCTTLLAVYTTFSRVLGANSGPNGIECAGKPTEGFFCICPRDTVCVTEWHEVIFLVLSRCSAYFDYPLYILLFLTKCHNLRGLLYRTHLSEWLPLEEVHEIHTFAGTVVSVEVIWHSFWHLLRWGVGGHLHFLWSHVTGRSGLVSLLLSPLIAWPMMFRRARRAIPYGTRKVLHYLSVVWGFAICFHAPKMHIAYIMGCATGCYALDWIVGYFLAIHFCPILQMYRLGATAVEVVFEHPPGFVNRGGGYIYICLPWLARSEWHAFSLYKHPTKANCSSVCIARLGDWTKDLHKALARPGAHPGWIYGPFPSPFSGATSRPNLLAVASGIGVTPTLGTISQLAQTHRVNVVWMCREHDLIEYFLRSVTFDDDAWSIIFYTGKTPLLLNEDQFLQNPRLLLVEGRPALKEDILSIIAAVETDSLLPNELLVRAAKMYRKTFRRSAADHLQVVLERATNTYTVETLYELAMEYSFTGTSDESDLPSESNIEAMETDIEEEETGSDELSRLASLCVEGATMHGFARLISELQQVNGIKRPAELDYTALAAIFSQLDLNSNGALEFEEFQEALKILKKVANDEEANSPQADTPTAQVPEKPSIIRMKRAESFHQSHFKEWGILYCGGAAQVAKTLKQMHYDLGVPVKIESFDW